MQTQNYREMDSPARNSRFHHTYGYEYFDDVTGTWFNCNHPEFDSLKKRVLEKWAFESTMEIEQKHFEKFAQTIAERLGYVLDAGLIVHGVCVQARILRALHAARERVLARTPHQTLFWNLS